MSEDMKTNKKELTDSDLMFIQSFNWFGSSQIL